MFCALGDIVIDRVVMTRDFGLLTFYCVLTLTDCFLLKCFYRIDHTTWCSGLDCPVQHYNSLPVLLKREDSGQIDSGSHHIEHIVGIRNPRRHTFSKSRHRYYQNANSMFQCQRLLKCGDINPNPGPTKYPCVCCDAMVATRGAMLNVLVFLRTNTTGYQVLMIPGTAMPVLLNGFQTHSFLIQPRTRLTIRTLRTLTPLNPMSLLTTRPVSRLTTSLTCQSLIKTSTVFKTKWTK